MVIVIVCVLIGWIFIYGSKIVVRMNSKVFNVGIFLCKER